MTVLCILIIFFFGGGGGGQSSFPMPKFNLELFKTLILIFAYIYSKRRKLSIFILCQEYQFIYPNKVKLPPIRKFPGFSILGT